MRVGRVPSPGAVLDVQSECEIFSLEPQTHLEIEPVWIFDAYSICPRAAEGIARKKLTIASAQACPGMIGITGWHLLAEKHNRPVMRHAIMDGRVLKERL